MTTRWPRSRLVLLLAAGLTALSLWAAPPAQADTAADNHQSMAAIATPGAATAAAKVAATTSGIEDDVCAVLKHGFDSTNTAYFTFQATYRTAFFQSAGLEYAVVQCLFLPLRAPNYGNLCQQAAWQIFPSTGPIQVSQVVPQGNPQHIYCPHSGPSFQGFAGAKASTAAMAGTDTLADDICAVLKHEFDQDGTGYYVYRTWTLVTYPSPAPHTDVWIKCLFVPKKAPNYGSLCGLYIAHLYPGDQYPHLVLSPVARWTNPPTNTEQHYACPPIP